MRHRRLWPALALAALLAWLVGYPLLMTVLQSLGLAPTGVRPGGGLSFEHYAEFARRGDEWLALWRSLWISVASVVLAAAVGVPLGFVFERTDFPGRRLLGALVALPVALPPLVGVIAFLFLYGESGFVSRGVQAALGLEEPPWRLAGAGAILLVHAYSMYVYFYLFTRAGLARLDAALGEAAASLGAGRRRTLLRVTLPLLRPALAGAALLTFMTALASFSAPYIFGGGFRVMTTQIVVSKLNGEDAMAQVETVTLALVALAGLWALQKVSPPAGVAGAVRGIAPARRRLSSPAARAGAAAAGWGLAAVLLLPHADAGADLAGAARHLDDRGAAAGARPLATTARSPPSRSACRPIVNSLWMAAAATVGGGRARARRGAGLAAAAAAGSGGLLEGLVALPWAIPGTVFAIALATTFSADQPWLGRFVLVGTPWILPLAYLVRDLPMTGRAALRRPRASSIPRSRRRRPRSAPGRGARSAGWCCRCSGRRSPPAPRSPSSPRSATSSPRSSSTPTTPGRSRSRSSRACASRSSGWPAVYGVLLMIAGGAAFLLWGEKGEA